MKLTWPIEALFFKSPRSASGRAFLPSDWKTCSQRQMQSDSTNTFALSKFGRCYCSQASEANSWQSLDMVVTIRPKNAMRVESETTCSLCAFSPFSLAICLSFRCSFLPIFLSCVEGADCFFLDLSLLDVRILALGSGSSDPLSSGTCSS